MKKHNAVKVVLITLLVVLLLSWILPAAYYSGEYVSEGRVQMGLFDLFNYPLTSLSYFGYIALFFVLVGGFYGVLGKIPAYRTFLDKIVAMFNGMEKLFISIVMILVAVIVSICGVQFEMFLFFPLIVAVILLMGYDKFVAAMTVVGSTAVGLAGTTYAYNNLNVLLSALSLKLDYEIGVRTVILLVGLVLLIFNTILYINKMGKKAPAKVEAKKVSVKEEVVEVKSTKVTTTKTSTSSSKKTNSKKSSGAKKKSTKSKSNKRNVKAAVKDEDVIVVREDDTGIVPEAHGKNHSTWALTLLFVLGLIVFLLAYIPWNENAFNVSAFTDATKSVTEFKMFGFPLFGKILGNVNAFGAWTSTDFYLVMALIILVLSIIYKVKLNDVLDGFAEGAKKALTPAVIVLLVYTVLVAVTYHPFQLVIYKALLGLVKGKFAWYSVFPTSLVAIIASVLNADPSYVFQSVLPYLVSLKIDTDLYGVIGIIFQSLYGLTVLVGPTSIVLLSVLSVLKISYLDWLKKIWKFALEFLAVLLIIFIILTLV